MAIHKVFNVTPFAAGLGFCTDRDGRDLSVAVIKATFDFAGRGEVAPAPPDAQPEVLMADRHFDDPATSSLRYATDISPPKLGTDVAVVGNAYGRGKKEVQAGFRLGKLEKFLAVSGPRVWVAGFPVGIAGPVPFDQIPLRYEQAFGGGSAEEDAVWLDNPVGVGFAKEVVDRAPLPSIEYRNGRYTSLKDRPLPAGLGFIPSGWRQRSRFAGTFDAGWEKSRRPLLPADLDERFWNAVPQDQVHQPKLMGGETLVLQNLHPENETIAISLPRLAFTVAFRVKEAETVLPMTADTLLVEPDEGRLSITYRAILQVGDDRMRVKSVVIEPARGAAPAAGATQARTTVSGDAQAATRNRRGG